MSLSELRDDHGRWIDGSGTAVRVKTKAAPSGRGSLRAQQKGLKLTPESTAALHDYQQGDHYDDDAKNPSGSLNEVLRAGTVSPADAKRVEALDNAFREVPPTTKAFTIHRGVSNVGGQSIPSDVKAGDVIADPGYMSTSHNKALAQEFADNVSAQGSGDILSLTLPAGSHPIDANSLLPGQQDKFDSEEEVLLPRGAKIQITKVTNRVKARKETQDWGNTRTQVVGDRVQISGGYMRIGTVTKVSADKQTVKLDKGEESVVVKRGDATLLMASGAKGRLITGVLILPDLPPVAINTGGRVTR